MADYFNVTKSIIMGDISFTPSSVLVLAPLYGSIAAEAPIEMMPVNDMKEAPARFMNDSPNRYLVQDKRNSMNCRIQNGGYALVSPKKADSNGHDMYLIAVNGNEATIKEVHQLENGIELAPGRYGPAFRPQAFGFNETDTPPVKILGEIVCWCAKF